MGKYFGTDGFRGEVNRTLTADHAYKIGKFIGRYFGNVKGEGERQRIVIGKDTRRSSYMYEYALAAGLTAVGADAYLLHVTTTPSVSFVTRTDNFDCGIMITASHNAYPDNGIKLVNRKGEKPDDGFLNELEAYLDSAEEIPLADCEHVGRTVDYAGGRNRYIGYLISISKCSYKGIKVGLDCANGAAWMIARSVFDALGAKTYLINAQPNGFNVNQNAGSTAIGGLQRFVLENELDIGFAFDGDADRCLCVDERGSVVDGDDILFICADYMKKQGELAGNAIVTTVMSNLGLYRALAEHGISYEQTEVGDKFVYERMQQSGIVLGGEQSGHIIFSKHETTGDGIVTAIKLMEVMIEEKRRMSELKARVKHVPQVLKNVRVRDKDAVMRNEAFLRVIAAERLKLGENGRIIVRASGTEPLVRVMVEAEKGSAEIAEELAALATRSG